MPHEVRSRNLLKFPLKDPPKVLVEHLMADPEELSFLMHLTRATGEPELVPQDNLQKLLCFIVHDRVKMRLGSKPTGQFQ